jgi:energy-coupling factor transport system ATP-binding protein
MFIGTEKLTHTYMPGTPYANEAIHEVSFSLNRGDFALVIGPSGSGKSTLIQHLNGLLKPGCGRVYYDGKAVGSEKGELLRLRRRVGLVFQMPEDQFFSETVFDEVAYAPRNLGLDENDVRTRVADALGQVGLDAEKIRQRHPFQLSAGQKRLVAIAAVLSLKPEVMILDEPTAGLDSAAQRKLLNLLAKLNRDLELTVIISTHHLDDVAALANKVLVLNDGHLVMFGPVEEVFARRDELHALGLALPAVTDIMHNLADKGLNLSRNIYSIEDARREIVTLKRRQMA